MARPMSQRMSSASPTNVNRLKVNAKSVWGLDVSRNGLVHAVGQ